MGEGILGNATGGFGFPKTYIITDSDGNELTCVYVESETIFTATDNDVREGMVYASDNGVSEGTKNIPAYRTYKESYLIFAGESFSIPLSDYNLYDYTGLQCIIAKFNTNFTDSVDTDKIVIDNHVYGVNSTTILSNISKNSTTKSIDLNINNDSENDYVIHYILYREEE